MNKCNGLKYENVLGNKFICYTEDEITTISTDADIINRWKKDTPMYFAIEQELKKIDQQDKVDDIVEDVQEAIEYITKFRELAKKVGFWKAVLTLFSKSKKEELEQQGFFLRFDWLKF